MAYRRRQNITRGSTFKDESHHHHHQIHNSNDDVVVDHDFDSKNFSKNYTFPANYHDADDHGSLAARAIKASAAHRDSSAVGYAYASSSFDSSKGSFLSDGNSMKDTNDQKYGLWGVLARKAKSILDEDGQFEPSNKMKSTAYDTSSGNQFHNPRQSSESGSRSDNARFRKGIDAITSSLNHLGDTLGNAFEEGRTIVEHKTADIIQETRNKTADILQETRRIQIRRRGGGNSDTQDAVVLQNTSWQRPVIQPVQTSALANPETQLKASRDVAMATAAKAKVLLRELKTVKADLAFAKERCSQLEEENKRLRESREKGDNPADDDLIRLQLETLLAEKARLAHENSIYARENRFLREIVEYHQLTMQDVVYLDEGAEEVSEVYPFSIDDGKVLFSTPTSPISPSFLPEVSSIGLPPEMEEHTREVPNEVSNLATSLSCPSSPPKICTSSSLSEKTESSKVPIQLQTVMPDKNIEAAHNSRPKIPVADKPAKPADSST
ncbi:hypothetical protein vseg_003525 [Gypsophila vaccaria]